MILAFLAFAWLLGIAAGAFTDTSPAASLAACGLLAALSFMIRPRPATIVLIACGAVLIFVGGWRYDSTISHQSPLARLNGGAAVRLKAIVDDEPDDRSSARLYRLEVREVRQNGRWRPESGGVIMRAPLFPEYGYGDLLEIEGKLGTPPADSEFDYREYLLRRGVDSLVDYANVHLISEGHGNPMRAALIGLRSKLQNSLSNVLPEPDASLAGGVLLGTRSALPQYLKDDMNATGTSHLVAVSGQNVALVAGLLIALFARVVGRRRAAWIALIGLLAYATLVGGQPSVVRAAIMGGLYVSGIALGRQSTAAFSLMLAAAVMTVFDPQVVRDVSFQLSFAATLGLILMTPALGAVCEQFLARWPPVEDFPLTRLIVETAVMTLAATTFTLPIIAINFHRVSLVTPLANLFVVPAFLLVAATSALTALTGMVVPGGAGFMVWMAWPPAAYMIGVIRLFADMPLASLELRGVGVELAVGYYAVLLVGLRVLARRPTPRLEVARAPITATPRRIVPAGALALVLGLLCVLLWLLSTTPASGRLSVTFLDVGQGDAILIEGPGGNRILVDGGPSGEAIASALGRQLPFYDRRIDLIVLTHPQADHLGGLPTVLDRYGVSGVLASSAEVNGAGYRAWREALASADVPPMKGVRGQSIDLGEGARLAVLGPAINERSVPEDKLNDASVVLRLEMGAISFLLTGDIGQQGEAALIRSGGQLRTTVLKVAHHGSRTSTSRAFLRWVEPAIDVISVGAKNPFGHPTPEVLERLTGDLVLRTDRQGDITLSTDGDRLWVQTDRDIY